MNTQALSRTALAAAILAVAAVVPIIILIIRQRKTTQAMQQDPDLVQPVKGRISSPYGYRTHPVTGQRLSFHSGTDVAVAVGTPVRAPWDGTIKSTYIDSQYGGGLTLLVSHPNGYTTGYCHLRDLAPGIQTGAAVRAGQTIAYSGGDPAFQPNSGSSTGPHLHVSLRNPQGVKIDPQSVFSFQ